MLFWLAKSPGTYHRFVANRISAITQIIDSDRWFYLATEDNPADLASLVMTQKVAFSEEYQCLAAKRPIPASSSILCLNPFLSDNYIIRSCGQLEATSRLTYDEKHPIILPYSCQYSRLLVRFIHEISLHGGNQLVLRLLREQFWISRVKNIIINQFKPCVLYKQIYQKQVMAVVPQERSELSR